MIIASIEEGLNYTTWFINLATCNIWRKLSGPACGEIGGTRELANEVGGELRSEQDQATWGRTEPGHEVKFTAVTYQRLHFKKDPNRYQVPSRGCQ